MAIWPNPIALQQLRQAGRSSSSKLLEHGEPRRKRLRSRGRVERFLANGGVHHDKSWSPDRSGSSAGFRAGAGKDPDSGSVARMDGIAKIDAGEDSENIGLQKGDEQFQRGQGHGQRERKDRAENAENAEGAEHADETGKHLQRDVACKQVAKSRTECDTGFSRML
jgi:hypothetical protein